MMKSRIEELYPLSPMQSGLLFQSLYAPQEDTYFLQSLFKLNGIVESDTLQKAWQKVCDHHSILRTGFIWHDGEEPLQYALENVEVPFQVENWQELSEEEQYSKLKTFLKKDREVGFNLAKPPLFRIFLICLASKQYYLIWSQHHILIDGWCWPIILNDVFKAYETLRLGKSPSFTLRRPYQDYISWLQEHDIDQAQNFWKNYLSDLEEPTRLSFQELIDKNREKDYDVFSLTFTTEETDAIKRFAQQNSLTVNTVIQGAVGIVLKTYTQKQDFVLGITISGRSIDLPGIEEMVGLFINTLPLKISFNKTDTTLSFLRKLQEQTQTLNDYAYTPLPQIQSWLGTNESLFDVLFVFENYPLDDVENMTPGFSVKAIQGLEKTEYPLTIVVGPEKQLYLSISYQTHHFNEELIQRFAQHLKCTLKRIPEHHYRPPDEISIITPEEEHQLLVMYNDTQVLPENKKLISKNSEKISTIPLGRPIANVQTYILDPSMNPVPIGISGEIYIGGTGLSRGYLNRPDLTADRFLPNPFITKKELKHLKNLRLYRTGDLARYLLNGNIEFLGRMDDQVKIRGYRIELGEIESVLNAHKDIFQAIVLTRENEPGDKRLAAYIIPHKKIQTLFSLEPHFAPSEQGTCSILNSDSSHELIEEFRNYLSQSLPNYMIPSFFIMINRFPLTSNGKIDRKALPQLSFPLRQDNTYAKPKNQIEKKLAQIWSEILKVKPIGIYDNFFKLGGHSLLATQVISRIRHDYNIDIPLRALFEHPTLFALSEVVRSLIKENNSVILPLITAMPKKELIPLSFAQQRLWFVDQLLPKNILYNIPLTLRLKGSLNIEALERAINTLLQRHESLRTIFTSTDGQAYQLILPELTIPLEEYILDLTHLSEKERAHVIESTAQQEATTPFNLLRDPLIRVKLLDLSKNDYALFVTLHHIICDGWSLDIFFKELSLLYNAYESGNDIFLPPLDIQYSDFAVWQRQCLQGDLLEKQVTYWKKQLEDIPDLIDFPLDNPRKKEVTYRGSIYRSTFSKEIKHQLNTIAQDHQASLFMVLLASFQILLYRYTDQKDIVIGSPIANRHYKETENIIGFFVNTLALRMTFKGDETFIDVLNQVKETTLQAYQHQDIPFEQLVDHLNVKRELNRNPVFQIMFVLQNTIEDISLDLNQLCVEPISSSYSISKFDLAVNISEAGEGLDIAIEYATDILEETTIARMIDHFRELLLSILKNPSQSIQEYSILTNNEKQQLLFERNEPHLPISQDKTIHQLFEEQTIKTPHHVAVVFEDQELTYHHLNEKANLLAHALRKVGVGASTLVALAVDRSLETIVGLLGILKAGGAYVPIDPTYPNSRLNFMLENSQASILLTNSDLKHRFAFYQGTLMTFDDVLLLDRVGKDTSNPMPVALSHHLAYIIYTSGSTGKPKGTMITHKSLIASTLARKEYYQEQGTSTLLIPSISFDSSVGIIFSSLTEGGTIVIPPQDLLTDLDSLISTIENKKISYLLCTPTFYNQLLLNPNVKKLAHLKRMIVAGENCSEKLLTLHSKLLPKTTLFNEYGPTEATVWSSVTILYNHNYDQKVRKINIGKPHKHAQLYILDQNMNPLSIGIKGEIYIGGSLLAQGYLSHPTLTAEKFVPNPFITHENLKRKENLRLYRTGDLARYSSDGNIEFLGRMDDQVKIRGFRVELGEIEATLNSHGDIIQAILTTQQDDFDHRRLIAYIVAGDFIPTTTELKEYLLEKLPNYMVPTSFIFIDNVPLTPHGKIDRQALPKFDLNLTKNHDYVAPRTPLEQKLCEIWSEILRIERISIHDNFFGIGGDSIISIQLIAKARQKGIYFNVKDIFNNPTLSELASVTKTQENIVTLNSNQEQVQGDVLLTPIQEWFFKNNHQEQNDCVQAILMVTQKELTLSVLKLIFTYLISHHDALKLRYHCDSPKKWKQKYLEPPTDPHIELIDLSSCHDEDLSLKIEKVCFELQKNIDIKNGPLLKVVLFHCGNERPQQLLIMIHHLIIDGVSWRIILEDIETLFLQLSEEKAISLLPKTNPYQQWAKALYHYAESQNLKDQIPFWKEIEKSIRPFPCDFNVVAQSGFQTYTFSVFLTKEETLNLLQAAPKAYRTQINDLLLTALVLAIGDSTQEYSLSLILEGHGREDVIEGVDVSRTIGWFTSLFPVNLSLSTPHDLGNAIKTIKETLRTIPDKGIGYGVLSFLRHDTGLGISDPPTISFNYQGQWDNVVSPKGLLSFSKNTLDQAILAHQYPCYLLNINAEVREDIFQIFWTYSSNHYHHHTIEKISDNFAIRLRQIINHCCEKNKVEYTPSDFKLVTLAQIDVISQIINEKELL